MAIELSMYDIVYKPRATIKAQALSKLAKLSSSRAMVPTGVFLHELHEPTISKALAKANNVAESYQETLPPPNGITESPKVMEIHSDRRTLFMIYLRTGGLPKNKVECE
jgi:hypothetical protein